MQTNFGDLTVRRTCGYFPIPRGGCRLTVNPRLAVVARQSSSGVEQRTHKPKVGSSNLPSGTMSTQFPERLAYLGRSLDEFNQHSFPAEREFIVAFRVDETDVKA